MIFSIISCKIFIFVLFLSFNHSFQKNFILHYQNINGKFEINSYIGTPPKNIVFVIDLISSFTWLSPPNFDPKKSNCEIFSKESSFVLNNKKRNGQIIVDYFSDNNTNKLFQLYFYYIDKHLIGESNTLSLRYYYEDHRMSIVSQMKKSGLIDKEIFTFIPSNKNGEGDLHFGVVPSEKINNLTKIEFTIPPKTYEWEIPLTGIWIGDSMYVNFETAYFNTINSEILVPRQFMNFLKKHYIDKLVNNKICYQGQDDYYMCECDKIDIEPKFYFSFERKKVFIKKKIIFSNHRPICSLRIRENHYSQYWEIGTSFLQEIITSFNYENSTITMYIDSLKFNDDIVGIGTMKKRLYLLLNILLIIFGLILIKTRNLYKNGNLPLM